MSGTRPSDPTGNASTQPEQEFLAAIERYRSTNRRPFPTWSEVLEVAQTLGYRKAAGDGRGLEHGENR